MLVAQPVRSKRPPSTSRICETSGQFRLGADGARIALLKNHIPPERSRFCKRRARARVGRYVQYQPADDGIELAGESRSDGISYVNRRRCRGRHAARAPDRFHGAGRPVDSRRTSRLTRRFRRR